MADPLSITGGTVGVISLALTTCQGIFTYYESYKTQNQDVCNAMQNLQLLIRSLSLIQDCMTNNVASQEAIAHIENCITSCRDATFKLDGFLQKYHQNPSPTSLKERLHICEQRILFPFKKSTLKNLSATIRDFKDNLTTGLQIILL